MYRIALILFACSVMLTACSGPQQSVLERQAAASTVPHLSDARDATVIVFMEYTTQANTESSFVLNGVAVGPNHVLTSALPYRQLGGKDHAFSVVMFNDDRTARIGPVATEAPRIHDESGLMLLKTESELPAHVELAARSPSVWQTVYNLGHLTYGSLLPLVGHRGMISVVHDQGSGPDLILVEMPVDRGSVGSGVFDGTGRLAGLVVSLLGHQENSKTYDLDRAAVIGVDDFSAFLKAGGVGTTHGDK